MIIRTGAGIARSLYILILVCGMFGSLFAQSSDPVKSFEQNKAKYTREFFSMGEDASSGYDYVFYKSGTEFVMIRVIWSASYTSELRISDFYFDDDLAFHRKQTTRKRQLSLLKRGRDIPMVVKEEHHFAGGKLTKWILENKTISSTDARWTTTEKEILEHGRSERESYTFLKKNQ